MNIYLNDVPIEDLIDNRPLEESYKDMSFVTPIAYNILEQYYSTEGIVWDTARAIKSGVKLTRQAGKKAYSMSKRSYRNLKDKWNKIKPIIVKSLKDLAINLSNMYGRFMKYDKDYAELAKRIDSVINTKVPLLGQIKTDIYIDIYDINIDVLAGVCKMVESYQGFIEIVVNEFMGRNFLTPEEFLKLVDSNINRNTGEVNVDRIRSQIDTMVKGIGNMNYQGELSIPKKIWESRKWSISGIPSAISKRSQRKDNKKAMDNSTAAGFTKLGITGSMEELTISGEDMPKFKNLLVKPNKTGYLNIMKDFLNNRIIEQTLKKSGSSMKKEIKEAFKSLDTLSDQLNKRIAFVEDIKNRNSNDEESDLNNRRREGEQIKTASTGEPQFFKRTNKNLSNSDSGQMDVDEDSLDGVVESYLNAMSSFIMNTSSVYGSMVNGLTSASFDIIVNCKNIVDKIDSLASVSSSNSEYKRGGKY